MINQLILLRLPFLDLTNTTIETRVDIAKKEVMYLLQPYTKIALAEVENEGEYSMPQKSLVAAYTAYNLLKNKVIITMAGDSETGESATNTFLKKAKADVVETEFGQIKASDGASIAMDTEKLMSQFKSEICEIASMLGIRLPICACDDDTISPPFIVVR